MQKMSMIILAGGASSRMGRDKSDLVLHGRTFLETQIEKGRMLGIEDILVSGYRGNICSVPVIKDRFPGKGPLGGLEACLRATKHEWCLVLGVDVPLVPVRDLEQLIQKALSGGSRALILQHGEHEESLVGVYHTSLADEMTEEITKRKGSVFAFLNRIGYETYLTDTPDAFFSNINDPPAYIALNHST